MLEVLRFRLSNALCEWRLSPAIWVPCAHVNRIRPGGLSLVLGTGTGVLQSGDAAFLLVFNHVIALRNRDLSVSNEAILLISA